MSTSAQRNLPIWFSWNLMPGLVSVPKASTIKNTARLNRASGLGRVWDSGCQVGACLGGEKLPRCPDGRAAAVRTTQEVPGEGRSLLYIWGAAEQRRSGH